MGWGWPGHGDPDDPRARPTDARLTFKGDGMDDVLTDLGQSLLDFIEQSNKENSK
jgi:hypothetical protein